MSDELRESFRVSFVGGPVDVQVPPARDLLARVRAGAAWDEASISRGALQFPRVSISWHEGSGFVLQCFENEQSWGYFAARGEVSSPAIDVVLGGQAMERWPPELFIAEDEATEALDFFLDFGMQSPGLRWVRTDAFPRHTVWEGRGAREAWEKAQARGRDV